MNRRTTTSSELDAAITARLDQRDRELRLSILTSEMLRIGIRVQKHWPTLTKFREAGTADAVNDLVALSMCKPGLATSRAIETAIDVAVKRSQEANDERDKLFWRNVKKECNRLKELSDEAAALGAQ